MDIRFAAARSVAKLVKFASRVMRAGGGTTLPGKVALHIDPRLLSKLSAKFPMGTIIVTGTNGKTTTAGMLAAILQKDGRRVVHNTAGANLRSGLATALLGDSGDVAILEVDEATAPRVANDLNPRFVVVTNVFRDQLDRYGELDHTAALINSAIKDSGEGVTAVLNADDPRVAGLAEGTGALVVHYGLSDKEAGHGGGQRDSRDCVVCGSALEYELYFYAHLGHYDCPSCGAGRPGPAVSAEALESLPGGTAMGLRLGQGEARLTLPVSGLYNVYNAMAAAATAEALGSDPETIVAGLQAFKPAFGRMEEVMIEGRRLIVTLIKNPTGFDQVVEAMVADKRVRGAVIAINDNLADGTDVSWLWDVNIERLATLDNFVASGIRAADMAVRLKYAGVELGRIDVHADLGEAIDMALEKGDPADSLAVVCTYTALFEARRVLGKTAAVKDFWDHGVPA